MHIGDQKCNLMCYAGACYIMLLQQSIAKLYLFLLTLTLSLTIHALNTEASQVDISLIVLGQL